MLQLDQFTITKTARIIPILLFWMHTSTVTFAQNASINVLTRESGIVKKGGVIYFEVTINNTDAVEIIGVYKLKAQVSMADSSMISIKPAGHQLPTGWEVLSQAGNIITISNGKDLIAPNDARTLLIALEGKSIGGPVSISGQLSFSNGMYPGKDPPALNGDKPADNFSTSSCKVID